MNIVQRYQSITVSLSEVGKPLPVTGATLSGNRIAFSTAGEEPLEFSGSVHGDSGGSMSGQLVSEELSWQAKRL